MKLGVENGTSLCVSSFAQKEVRDRHGIPSQSQLRGFVKRLLVPPREFDDSLRFAPIRNRRECACQVFRS